MVGRNGSPEYVHVRKNADAYYPTHVVVGFHAVREHLDEAVDWRAGRIATKCVERAHEECPFKDEKDGCKLSIYTPYGEGGHVDDVEFSCSRNEAICGEEVEKTANQLASGTNGTLREVLEMTKVPEVT